MDPSQIPSTDVKERYHQLALDIVKISAGIRDATREIIMAQKASTFDETVLQVLKSNVDVLMTRNSKQLELLELMSQLKKDPANTDALSGKDYDEALNDAVKEIDSTSKSTERVAKLLESRLATLKSMKEAGIAPPLERPLTPPGKLGEGKPLMTGGGANISLAADPVRVLTDEGEIATYIRDHNKELIAICPAYAARVRDAIPNILAWADRSEKNNFTLVLYEEGGKPEGFAFAFIDHKYFNPPLKLYLFQICAYPGRGIGTILLKRVEKIATQMGLNDVVLFHADEYSENFYKYHGYSQMPKEEEETQPFRKRVGAAALMTGGAEAVGYDGIAEPVRYNNVSCAHVSVAFLATYYPFLGPLAQSIPKTVQDQPDIFRRVRMACRDSNIATVETKGDDPYYPDVLGKPGVGMRVVDENCRVEGWGGLVWQDEPKPGELSHLLAVVREPLNIKGKTEGGEIIDLQGNIVYLWTNADDDGTERAADVKDLKYEIQSKSMAELEKRDDKFLYRLIKPTTILWIKSPIPFQDIEERRTEIREVWDTWNPKAKRRKPKLSQAAAGGPDPDEEDDDTEWEPPEDAPPKPPPAAPEPPKPVSELDQIRQLIEAENEVERRIKEDEERRRRFLGIGRGKRSYSASGLMQGGAEAVGYEGLRKPFTYNMFSCVHASFSFLATYYPFLRPIVAGIPNTAVQVFYKLREVQDVCKGLGIETIYMEGEDPAEPDRTGKPGIPYSIVHDYCRVKGWGGIMIQNALKSKIGHVLPFVRENLPYTTSAGRPTQGLPVYLLTTSTEEGVEKPVSTRDLAHEDETLPFGKKKFNKIGPSYIFWICKEIPLSASLEERKADIAKEPPLPDAPAKWILAAGRKAVLIGLVSKPELNGKTVNVFAQNGDRWLVKLEGAEETMRIKPENLTGVGLAS